MNRRLTKAVLGARFRGVHLRVQGGRGWPLNP